MRIRSIKPEFWGHPVMARLPDSLRLLALGLLSYADDEGYFLAEPALVKAALMPFSDLPLTSHGGLTEDSVSVHGMLTELSIHGWITLKKHPEQGMLGMVVNFTKHQKINRPTRSRVSTYFNSLKAHGGLTEGSLHDQGIEGSREQGGKVANSSIPPQEGENLFGQGQPEPLPEPKPLPPSKRPCGQWVGELKLAGVRIIKDDRETIEALYRELDSDNDCKQCLELVARWLRENNDTLWTSTFIEYIKGFAQ